MNTTTPRVFIAATRQNEGKTTVSLGLIAALQQHFPLIGYIKPVGQRFVEIEEQKIDEDIVLMDAVYQLNCPLVDMSPIAVAPAFTRIYLESANNEALVKRIQETRRTTQVVVAHNLALALRIGTHIAVLHQGRIVDFQPANALSRSDNPHTQDFIRAANLSV